MLNRCYLCKEKEETSDHLFLFCKKATMLWSLIFSLFGVQWVLHSSIKRNLLLVGMVPLWVRGGRRLGGLPLYAYCGPYGRKEMKECSMISNGRTKI